MATKKSLLHNLFLPVTATIAFFAGIPDALGFVFGHRIDELFPG